MKRILNISFLTIMLVVFCTSCVAELFFEDEMHYDTGRLAYEQCYERGLSFSSSALFYEAKRLDDFIGFIEDNTLPDRSNELQVWLEADQKYYPYDKLRKNGDTWYVMQYADTACIINTRGDRFNAAGAEWLVQNKDENRPHRLSYTGENRWNMVVDDYSPAQMDDYLMSIDADLFFTVIDSLRYEITGDYDVTLSYDYYSDSDDVTFIVDSTIDEPLTYIVSDYSMHHGTLMEGDFGFLLTDPSIGVSEYVEVTIVSVADGTREVYVKYKDDIVSL